MPLIRKNFRFREFRASMRDTLLLLREFRNPVIVFVTTITGFGILYYYISQNTVDPPQNIPESIYLMLTLTFLQSGGEFPQEWYLEIFYFLMPILGISVLAQGLAEFGVMFFNRRSRRKEWEMAVASTYNNHIILVGLGHLGYRVAKILHEMNEDVVVIEKQPKTDLLESIRSLGIPVIQDDATRDLVLESAGIKKAQSIILCTQNDSLNLQIAVKARSIKKQINVVIRIFDDDFAHSLSDQFGFRALSATTMAAPVFAATAANIDITPPLSIEGQPNSLAKIKILPSSHLIGTSLEQIEAEHDISIVLLNHEGKSDIHPPSRAVIMSGDIIAVLGDPNQISKLINRNH